MADVTINHSAFLARLRDLVAGGARHASTALVSHLQVKLNVSARTARPIRKIRGGRKSKGWRYEPSRPGEPPRKRTGTLQKSVAATTFLEPGMVVTRVGSKVPYAPFLEFGTKKMAARPWLRPGVAEFGDRFHRLLIEFVRARMDRVGAPPS